MTDAEIEATSNELRKTMIELLELAGCDNVDGPMRVFELQNAAIIKLRREGDQLAAGLYASQMTRDMVSRYKSGFLAAASVGFVSGLIAGMLL